jgi:hypothetical protein
MLVSYFAVFLWRIFRHVCSIIHTAHSYTYHIISRTSSRRALTTPCDFGILKLWRSEIIFLQQISFDNFHEGTARGRNVLDSSWGAGFGWGFGLGWSNAFLFLVFITLCFAVIVNLNPALPDICWAQKQHHVCDVQPLWKPCYQWVSSYAPNNWRMWWARLPLIQKGKKLNLRQHFAVCYYRSKDNTVSVWDIVSGACVMNIGSHLGEVTSVDMHTRYVPCAFFCNSLFYSLTQLHPFSRLRVPRCPLRLLVALQRDNSADELQGQLEPRVGFSDGLF